MNKVEFINMMREEYGVTKKVAEEALKMFWGTIDKAFEEGNDSIQFVGHGKFSLMDIEGKEHKNPRNPEETVFVEAHKRPKFLFAKTYKDKFKA